MKHKFLLPIAALMFCLSAQAQTQLHYLKKVSHHNWFSGQYHLWYYTDYLYTASNPRTYQPDIDRWSYDTSLTINPAYPDALTRTRQMFDAQGRVAVVEHEYWNFGMQLPGYRMTYTYDAAGNLITVLREDYKIPGSYTNNTRVSYTYNANNQPIELANEHWSTSGSVWVVDNYVVYNYNSNGQLIEEMVQRDQLPLPRSTSSRKTYTYTGNNNTEILSEVMYPYSSTFRWFNTFDANGWLTGSERQEWVFALSYWKKIDSLVLTNDNAGNVLLRESRAWDGNAYVNNVANSYTWVPTATPSGFSMASNAPKIWNSTANIYEPSIEEDSVSYVYEVLPVSVANTYKPAPHISIFPNPAGGFVNIDALPGTNYNAIIIDMAGKIVKSFSGNINRLDVQDIPAGNYLLQVHAGGAVAVEKLVIAR